MKIINPSSQTSRFVATTFLFLEDVSFRMALAEINCKMKML